MSAKSKKGLDPAKFEGNGVSFKAKMIGIETVPEARGDPMCQEAIAKLKNAVKVAGQHKQKVFVNVTLEGLKIIDAISLLVLHTHQVHRISFISRDNGDSRAFGYVYGEGDGTHKFFAIKTASAAENLVLTLRDLFQVVYEMKKKEVDDAKEKMEKGEGEEEEENSKTSGDGSTSGNGQTPANQSADAENIYSGIEQIKNLEFDSMTEDPVSPALSPPTSPLAKLAPPSSATPTAGSDPWAAPAATPAASSSALGDLAGLQTSSTPAFPGMPGTMPFPGTPFLVQGGAAFPQMGGGLPVTKDPFGNDPFSANAARPVTGGPGFPGAVPGAANPFGAPQAFPGQLGGFGAAPAVVLGTPGMMPGAVAPGMVAGQPRMMVMQQPGMPAGMGNPFAAAGTPAGGQMPPNAFGAGVPPAEDPNLLVPTRKDEQQPSEEPSNRSKSPRADLFGDLVDIKKDRAASPVVAVGLTPKELFAQQTAAEKKTMNQLMADKPAAAGTPQASSAEASASTPTSTTTTAVPVAVKGSEASWDPFGDPVIADVDKTRSLLGGDDGVGAGGEDPFDTSRLPPLPPAPAPPARVALGGIGSSGSDTRPPPVPSRSSIVPPPRPRGSKGGGGSTPSTPCTPSTALPPPPSSSPPSVPAPSLPPPPLPSIASRGMSSGEDQESKTDSSADGEAFQLPSPDEPPPPLPASLSDHAPPPPPPRPKSSLSRSSSSALSSPCLHHSFSTPSDIAKSIAHASQASSVKIDSSTKTCTPSHKSQTNNTDTTTDHNKHNPGHNNRPSSEGKSSAKLPFESSPFDSDPFCVPLKSTTPKKSSTSSSSSVQSNQSPSRRSRNKATPKEPFPKQSFVNESDKDTEAKADDFNPRDTPSSNSDNIKSPPPSSLNLSNEEDPFGQAGQLTSSFKVTAKFGSDPFEDSFTSASVPNGSSGNPTWDAFTDKFEADFASASSSGAKQENDAWGSSPFGDSFGAAPVNGNTTGEKSLFD